MQLCTTDSPILVSSHALQQDEPLIVDFKASQVVIGNVHSPIQLNQNRISTLFAHEEFRPFVVHGPHFEFVVGVLEFAGIARLENSLNRPVRKLRVIVKERSNPSLQHETRGVVELDRFNQLGSRMR